MTRHFWVLLHRYAGLYMAFFLTVAGLTGSVLAFYHELDGWLNSEHHQVAILDRPMLDDFVLRDKALALLPQAQINQVSFNRKPGQVYEAGLTPRTDPATGKPYELGFLAMRLNPYSGELIDYGKDEGYWPLTRRNILNFIYALHYSLALGEVGVWLFGIAALIWTIDCFVAFYLTFPVRRKKVGCAEVRGASVANDALHYVQHILPFISVSKNENTQSGFWSRWALAWKVKWPASAFRLNFDLHRAGGLWTWLMLFVFAWSSVGFNLGPQVYQPVMKTLFDLPDFSQFPIANLPQPRPAPNIAWQDAHAIGRSLMAEQARLNDFQIINEEALQYQPDKGLFGYVVMSDRDINDKNGSTIVFFDGDSGAFVSLFTPSRQNAGMTISMWLFALHMAAVWGLPYKIFVCLMGLVVAMLSVTGVYIWLKKRRASKLKRPVSVFVN
ncbi:PepSY-associated TM helix domain-containing protein [Methylomonas albis]|uniref:PepSY domain-containing protein n=1 Tax=Methylomonas albis TaxID=1854563 RepID=A0ABR9CYQ5_9GAMM|nr:PepSY-associated TM helix domain-containing protein [Methylomonas albis]MBD9355825.1 PepSY domain-containing protein [Methylomonas albis]